MARQALNRPPQRPGQSAAWTWLGALGRVALGAAFMTSGYSKLVAPVQEFQAVLESYQLLPRDMTLPFATVMPWLELFLGAFVLLGYWRRKSAVGLGALLSMFVLALLTAQARGLDLGSCGCFGRFFSVEPWKMTLIDVTLSWLAFCVWKDRLGPISLDRWIGDDAA
jgi:uncharacterized membrane protein YphA (DoxX/SURF4 family)